MKKIILFSFALAVICAACEAQEKKVRPMDKVETIGSMSLVGWGLYITKISYK